VYQVIEFNDFREARYEHHTTGRHIYCYTLIPSYLPAKSGMKTPLIPFSKRPYNFECWQNFVKHVVKNLGKKVQTAQNSFEY
jgi:hypothetical protein